MTTDENEPKPQVSRFPWRILLAIPLFIYSLIPLALGGWGLLGMLIGVISFAGHPIIPKMVAWVLFHAAIMIHGYTAMVAALSFGKSRWKRAQKALVIALGLFLLFVIFAAKR
jgi:hypothetical protein